MPHTRCATDSLSQRCHPIETNVVGFQDRPLLTLEGRDGIAVDLDCGDRLALGLYEVGFPEQHFKNSGNCYEQQKQDCV